MGTLFVVATPIGNLEDVTLRALRVLREVDLILAEDTRTARVLLGHYGIEKSLLSYTEHNRRRRIPEAVDRLAGADLALISDAGTPAISDPGVELVAAARDAGRAVVAVPGPSAVPAALSIAGLRTLSYCFAGFLPRQEGALRRLFEAQRQKSETLVAFESPQRLPRTLSLLVELLPERRLAVCRELTKLHEEVFVGLPAAALERFPSARGEVVLVIEGSSERQSEGPDEAAVKQEMAFMREVGLTRAQAAALLASRYDVPKRRLYDLWLGK
jgi:16S rRNA (cytidine1402-2'-O)-methyltransferase